MRTVPMKTLKSYTRILTVLPQCTYELRKTIHKITVYTFSVCRQHTCRRAI